MDPGDCFDTASYFVSVLFFVYFPILFITGISGYAQACIFNHIFDRLIEDGGIQEKTGKDFRKTREAC